MTISADSKVERPLGYKGPGRLFLLKGHDPTADELNEKYDGDPPIELWRSVRQDVHPFCFNEADLGTRTVRINVLRKMHDARNFNCVLHLSDLNAYPNDDYIDGRENYWFKPASIKYPEMPNVGNIYVYPESAELEVALEIAHNRVQLAINHSDELRYAGRKQGAAMLINSEKGLENEN